MTLGMEATEVDGTAVEIVLLTWPVSFNKDHSSNSLTSRPPT